MAGSQEMWRISGEDRSKHDAQFFQLKPVNGFVTGTQARDFFMQSGLSTSVLGQIWSLADMNGDGKMDKKEFSIAMHLIKKKLQGYELPKVLPAILKADPTPVIGSFAQPAMTGHMPQPMGLGFPLGGIPASIGGSLGMPVGTMMQPQASLGTATMTTGSLSMGPRMANGATGSFASTGTMAPLPMTTPVPMTVIPVSTALPAGGSIWTMPHNTKLKHTQTFNANDRQKRGYLLGVEARAVLMQSGLLQQVLAQIWTLSDIDHDGKLTCDEFCIAMHLSELARMGTVLPPTLPPELIPIKTRSGSLTSPPAAAVGVPQKKDTFGDLLTNTGIMSSIPVASAVQPVEEPVPDEQVTFEDKRKENFDKGQAELERRRAILREQQQKEENERLEKERQEAEKRERQRIEAENRRQAELQRQLEKQREKEREIEEQRRKMVEQREAARRELERQRQMEWEKQRKEQLMTEKQRESEQLSIMKSQMANLKNELESLDAKKAELSLKISQVQKGVTDFTSSIDGMRVSRDRTLANIDLYEKQCAELHRKMASLSNEKDVLNVQVQTAQVTPLSDTHRTVMQSVESKRTGIQKLKKEMEQLESDTEARLGEIDCSNAELKNLKDQIAQLEQDLPQLQKQQEEKIALQKKTAQESQEKQKAEKEKLQEMGNTNKKAPAPPASKPVSSQPSWFDFNSSDAISSVAVGNANSANWDTAFSSTTSSATYSNTPAWDSSSTTTGEAKEKIKCRALYDFAATRDDELSLTVGMEVLVWRNYTPVPGMEDWYKGEQGGIIGWFPKAYVERLDEPSADLFGSAFEPVVQSSSAGKTKTVQPDLFSSQFSQPSAVSSAPVASSEDTAIASQIPPEGLLAKATYPWKARQESDLTFDKDDVILVKEQQDMKWFGELNGKSGWFPKAYVKLIGVAPKSGLPIESSAKIPVKAVGSVSASPAPPDTQGEYYIAMYSYTSDEPTDLPFNEGDMVYVTSASGDWWSGTIAEQGKSGMFPANYVKKLEIQPNKTDVQSGITSSNFDYLLGDFSSVSTSKASSSHNIMDNLFDLPDGGQSNSSASKAPTSNAVGDFDILGISFGGQPVVSTGFLGTSLSVETKPGQSVTLSLDTFSSDAVKTSQVQTLSSGSFAGASDDLFGDLTSLSWRFSGSAATSAPPQEGNLLLPGDVMKKTLDVEKAKRSASADLFSDHDPFGTTDKFKRSASADLFVLDDQFGNSISGFTIQDQMLMSASNSNPATMVSKQSNSLMSEFEDLGLPQPIFSDESLMSAFGNFNASTSSENQDLLDGFGLDVTVKSVDTNKTSFALDFIVKNDSLKSIASLPDILALENDAIQNDVFDIQNVASIMGNTSIPASQVSSDVQVNFDVSPKPARPPPPVIRHALKTPEKKLPPEHKSVKKPEIAKVIAPYVATGTGQLSLEIGNLINVRQKSPRGWWEGELQVRGQKKKIGWFPANYVKLLGGSSARSTPEPTAGAILLIGAQGSRSATPQNASIQDGVGSINQPETVVALYAYIAQNDDELTFQKDAVITVLSRDNPDWWSGQVDGQTGVFPSNYVTPNPQSQSLKSDKEVNSRSNN